MDGSTPRPDQIAPGQQRNPTFAPPVGYRGFATPVGHRVASGRAATPLYRLARTWASVVLLMFMIAGGPGCGPVQPPPSAPNQIPLNACGGFAPAWVRFVGLTGFDAPTGAVGANIRAYVDVLDAFDSRIKAPATFRFELYEYVPRSSEPRGRRIQMWNDIDLTDATDNNAYWRDFLRCYQFELPIPTAPPAGTYILEVTALTRRGTHLSATTQLAYPPETTR